MNERLAIVTGGTRGIGLETSRQLAARGYEVILTGRRKDVCDQAVEKVRAGLPDAKVSGLALDLTVPENVRAFAAAFHALGRPLHLLVNNAGVNLKAKQPSFAASGFELGFETNHLGPFLLTHLLMEDLIRAAPSRVVVVASAMHRKGVAPGPGPDFDYDNLKAQKSFEPTTAYRNTKLANLWFTFELARRLEGKNVSVLGVGPGWVPETQAHEQTNPIARFIMASVVPHLPFANTIKQGADNTVFAATDPKLQSQSGTYWEDLGPGVLSDEAQDAARARQLWERSLEWCGLKTTAAPLQPV
jgi:NAD(P)-dependent dehydrogenase (short-subunit alcohol dehydrogenase family)